MSNSVRELSYKLEELEKGYEGVSLPCPSQECDATVFLSQTECHLCGLSWTGEVTIHVE